LKKILALTLCSVLVFSLAACASGDDASGDADGPIRIGVVNPLSGAISIVGHDGHVGQMLAIDMFNERYGGVNGRLIEAVESDIPDAGSATTEMNRLIHNEGLSLITGCYGSSIVEVAAAIADRNNVFWWEYVSVLDRLTEQGYTSVFRVHISGSIFGEEAAQAAVDFGRMMGIEPRDLKLGVISENGDFGQSLAAGIVRFAEANNVSIVLNDFYDARATTDTTPIVMRMMAAEPDIVIATSYINDGIDITRKMKLLNWSPKVFLGIGSGYGTYAYWEALDLDAQGQLSLDPTNAPVLESLDPDMRELVIEFSERFEREKGYPPTTVGYLAFQATWILLRDVIAVVGDVDDVDALVAAAKNINLPIGTLPTGAGVKFNEKGQNERCVIAVMQWDQGRLVTVYPDFLATRAVEHVPMPPWDQRDFVAP